MSKKLTPPQVKAVKAMLNNGSFTATLSDSHFTNGHLRIRNDTMYALRNQNIINLRCPLGSLKWIATLTDRGREIAQIHECFGKEEADGSSKD